MPLQLCVFAFVCLAAVVAIGEKQLNPVLTVPSIVTAGGNGTCPSEDIRY